MDTKVILKLMHILTMILFGCLANLFVSYINFPNHLLVNTFLIYIKMENCLPNQLFGNSEQFNWKVLVEIFNRHRHSLEEHEESVWDSLPVLPQK